MWKILNNVSPNDINIKFRPTGRLGVQAVVPSLVSTSSAANQSIYDRSFAVFGPWLWNVIPREIAVFSSAVQFKSSLTGWMYGSF